MAQAAPAGAISNRALGRQRTVAAIVLVLALPFLVLATGLPMARAKAGAQACLQHPLPYLQDVSPDSIVIMWHTCIPVQGMIRYRVQGQATWTELEEQGPVTIHEVQIEGLSPAATYDYQVSPDGGSGWLPANPSTFTTAPGRDAAFRIVVYGDTRTEADQHARVIEAITASEPDLVLHVGDLVEYGRDLDQWLPQFFGPAGNLLTSTPLYPVPGSHEFWGSGPVWYDDLFSLPGSERWYAFSYGCIRIVGLNTEADITTTSDQYAWLEREMASPEFGEATWRLAFLHQPPYTSGHHLPSGQHLVPLYEQYGIDMVFAGHNHHYERSRKDGIAYVVTGGGGVDLHDYDNLGINPYSLVRVKAHHHTMLDVDCDRGALSLSARDTEGALIDGPLVLWAAEAVVHVPQVLRAWDTGGAEANPPVPDATGTSGRWLPQPSGM